MSTERIRCSVVAKNKYNAGNMNNLRVIEQVLHRFVATIVE